ncbi:MAG TPA: hypothetical protein VGB87_18295 [Vicinamibacteria bacterium]
MKGLTTKFCLVSAACALLAACDRDQVTHFRVAKSTPAAAPLAMPAAAASAPEVPEPPRPAAGGLRWTLPKGWTESAGGQMRFATLKAPVTGRIDGSVVVLPGPAGGELANVNRWRNQIGLPPLDEAGLAAARRVVRTKAGPLRVYDFTNGKTPADRVIAGLAESGGSTWFVKLSGDAATVGAAREDFMKLLGSLRFE